MLPTPRVPYCPPATLLDLHAPSLSPRDTWAVAISHGRGSDRLTKASGGGTTRAGTKNQVTVFGIYFGVVDSGFPFMFSYLQYTGFGSEKLDIISGKSLPNKVAAKNGN